MSLADLESSLADPCIQSDPERAPGPLSSHAGPGVHLHQPPPKRGRGGLWGWEGGEWGKYCPHPRTPYSDSPTAVVWSPETDVVLTKSRKSHS